MADKCIGKLTLDISDVSKKIEDVNKFLGQIGANINLEDKLSKKISSALNNLVSEAKKAGEEAQKALQGAANIDAKGGLESVMQKVTATVNTYTREIDNVGKATEKLVGTVQTGFDAAGNKIKEFADSSGAITKRTQEIKNSYDEEVNAAYRAYEAEEQLYQKQAEAAVQAGLKREEASKRSADAAQQAADKERELIARQADMMEEDYAKRQALLEKQLSADEAAQEKMRQKSIEAEFAKEEARKKSAAAAEEAAQREADLIQKEIEMMEEAIQKRQEAEQKQFETDQIERAKQAYFELTDAIKNYNAAKKAGDELGASAAQERINAAMQEVGAIQETVNASNLEANAKQQVLNTIQQCVTAEKQHSAEIAQSANRTGELDSAVNSIVTRYLSLFAVIRTINSLVDNMVEYVSEYADKMNEIQMITLSSNEEVAKLGETYRNIAKDMSVSSLDMAEAAVYFTRQGLEAADIEDRLKNVTMYAKAANVEFKDASEIITAVINSMNLVEQEAEDGRTAAQRVADVFLAIGDNAATSGQEIGEAMQKAAASAGSFGVSMEWLASYIATVSETTRQEARTIGTAFNTIIARLHQIKQTGYNQEDETKINDIAKALSKIDVALLNQDGSWRRMEDILQDVAAEWDGLDDKTKSYIATTMAGVKQQNVFLALMNDMAKGVEGNSRAFELHELAINSDGVAAEKYAVYLDSVTAAQERLNIAQEEFYSILSEDVLKGWYNSLAQIVSFITDATEAMGGLNIILPIVAGAVILFGKGIASLAAQITIAGSASQFFATVWESHPVLLVITGVAAAIMAITTAVGLFTQSTESMAKSFDEANQKLSESQTKLEALHKAQEDASVMFDDFSDKTRLTAEDLNEYNTTLEELAKVSPVAKHVVDELKSGFITQEEAAEKLNAELERLIENENRISMRNLMNRYTSYQPDDLKPQATSNLLNLMDDRFIQGMSNGDPQEAFKRALQSSYMSKSLGDDLQEYIKNLADEYSKSMSNEQVWDTIAGDMAYKLFGQFEVPENVTKNLVDQVNNEIEYVLSIVGKDMDIDEVSALRISLVNAIFGDDGELSNSEFGNFNNVISRWILEFASYGKDKIIEGVSDLDIAKDIANSLFGPEAIGTLFEDAEGLEEGFSKGFVDSFKELVQSGFTENEIKDIFSGIPQPYWNEAASILQDQMKTAIKESFGTDFLGMFREQMYDVDGEHFENYMDSLLWEDLDLTTLKSIFDMTEAGAITLDDVNRLMLEADGDINVFTESLKNYRQEVGFSTEDTEDFGDSVVTMSDKIKKVQTGIKDLRAIDAAIQDLKENGKDANLSDVFGIAELHPELLTVIGDTDALLAKLKEIRQSAGDNQRGLLRSIILGDEAAMSGSKYAGTGAKTLGEYRASLTDEGEIAAFDAELEKWVDDLMKANEDFKKAQKEEAAAAKEATKSFNDSVREVETLDKVIAKLQSNKTVDFSDIVNLSSAHPEIVAFANDADKLIEILQRLKEETKNSVKSNVKDVMMNSEEYFKESQYYDPNSGVKTMKEYIDSLIDARGNWSAVARDVDQAAEDIVNAAERTEGAAESWLEAQAKIAEINEEVNWAKSNNFEDQINQLQGAVESGGIQEAITVFNGWSTEMKDAIYKEYPEFIRILGNADKAIDEQGNATRDLTNDTKDLNAALSKAESLNNVKHFTDSAKAIKQLSEGTISATDAYDIYTKDLNKVTKAYEDILDVQNKMAYNAKEVNKNNKQAIDAGDVSNLASLLDMTTEEILADFPAAVDMFNELTGSAGELTDILNMLNDAAFVQITGTSDADFSAIEAGLIYVQNLADEAVAKLLDTGQWEVDTIQLNQKAALWNWDNNEKTKGHWSYPETIVGAQVLKPTGKNPFRGSSTVTKKADTNQSSGRSGGSGGGGGSSNKTTGQTEVEKTLDIMDQVHAIQEYQQSWYQTQQKYYQQTGQLQGVIAYMQKEKEAIEAQNPVLEKNVQEIERLMEQKKAEIALLSTDDEAYEDVADDLDKLQKAHQNYTKQLVDNSTAIESLNEQMDEQRKKIRQMEIDLRNTILSAIEDRERKREDMLNAEIEMENTILDLIKKRYEKERDHIIEVTNLKIQSLQEERDLLNEQLQLRKEQEEQEDKLLKLRELEVKYQRIVADPTRAKEAKSIRKEIDDLRKEIAWDTAEQEVKAQQDSIDQQITSLEDYSEYIQEYYEDLFEHPQKLIAEMREVIMMTQEEILEWLKNNDEAYQNSSELTQQKIAKGWENTYNEMKGILKLYWDEVEEIIAGGDEYIIQFLTENSADYAKAGKLQAEAYVDEWKKQLSDLKKAHEQVVANIAAEYEAIAKSTYVAPSGGGGSSGGGPKEDHGYSFTYGGKEYKANGFATREAADAAMKEAVSNIIRVGAGTMAGSSMIGQGIRAVQAGATVFAKGGIADFTGPAWLDGSPQDPERVLSPYQTKLFEAMVEALERASKITIPSMPNYGDIVSNGGNQISVGDIVVNVDNLDTDDDYEELAKKVSAILMERIGRTAVVGGMRINTI